MRPHPFDLCWALNGNASEVSTRCAPAFAVCPQPTGLPRRHAAVRVLSLERPLQNPPDPHTSPCCPSPCLKSRHPILNFFFLLINLEETLEIFCVRQGLSRQVEATLRPDERMRQATQRSAPAGPTGTPWMRTGLEWLGHGVEAETCGRKGRSWRRGLAETEEKVPCTDPPPRICPQASFRSLPFVEPSPEPAARDPQSRSLWGSEPRSRAGTCGVQVCKTS